MTIKRTQAVLPGAVFLAALATSTGSSAIAPMADPDLSFGSSRATAFASYDVPGSTLADRGVAVFADRATGGYIVIGEAASPTAGQTRIAISFFSTTGGVSSSVKTFDVLRVDAACQRPNSTGFVIGVVEGTTSENLSVIYAFDGAGNLDTSVFGGDGKITADFAGPERFVDLVCSASDVLVSRSITNLSTNASFGRTFRAQFSGAVSGGNSFTPVTGGIYDPIGMGRASSLRVPAVFAYKDDSIDNAISVTTYDDGTLVSSNTTNFPIPFATCGAMSAATSGRARVAKVAGDKVLVAGDARLEGLSLYTEYLWLLEINVPTTGAPTLGTCASRIVGTNDFVVGTNFFVNDLAVSADGTEAYAIGSGYRVDPIEVDLDFELYRFIKPGASWTALPGDNIAIEFAHGNNVAEADDQAVAGYIDARTTPNRLLVTGVRQWLGADTDVSLTRLHLAPLFADGLE